MKSLRFVFAFLTITLLLFTTFFAAKTNAKKKTSKKSSVKSKREKLHAFVKEDEGQLVEPYVGGYNSKDSTMLVVDFHDFEEVQGRINPRWKAFREMVEDMQKMLLTGGVKTNIFREGPSTIVCVLNSLQQLEMAHEFFGSQPEVKEIRVTNQDRADSAAHVVYGSDEL